MSFSDTYLDHFSNPRGIGEIELPTHFAEIQHEGDGCLDQIRLYLSIKDNIVKEVRFKARACSGTIAACSALTEKITGKSKSEAEQLTPEDLETYLEGIPPKKRHSVELAIKALKTALAG